MDYINRFKNIELFANWKDDFILESELRANVLIVLLQLYLLSSYILCLLRHSVFKQLIDCGYNVTQVPPLCLQL